MVDNATSVFSISCFPGFLFKCWCLFRNWDWQCKMNVSDSTSYAADLTGKRMLVGLVECLSVSVFSALCMWEEGI